MRVVTQRDRDAAMGVGESPIISGKRQAAKPLTATGFARGSSMPSAPGRGGASFGRLQPWAFNPLAAATGIGRPAAWAQGTREMLRARPDLIPSQRHLGEIGSESSQTAARTAASTAAMLGLGRDVRYRGLGAVPAVGGPIPDDAGGTALGRPISAPWQPHLMTGLPGPAPVPAADPGEVLRSLRPATSTELPISWSLTSGDDPFRRYTDLKRKQLDAALAGESDIPDVGAWVGPGRPRGARPLGTFEAIRRRDPELADSIQRRTKRRLAAKAGLPTDVRQHLRTARAQGRPTDPSMAALRASDPFTAALMERNPQAAALGPRDDGALMTAMAGLLSGIARSSDPDAAVAAVVRMLERLGLGGVDDGLGGWQ